MLSSAGFTPDDTWRELVVDHETWRLQLYLAVAGYPTRCAARTTAGYRFLLFSCGLRRLCGGQHHLFRLGGGVGTLSLGLVVRWFCPGTAGVSVNRARKLSTWVNGQQKKEQVMPWSSCYLLNWPLEAD
jgi:hypothetical protein